MYTRVRVCVRTHSIYTLKYISLTIINRLFRVRFFQNWFVIGYIGKNDYILQ